MHQNDQAGLRPSMSVLRKTATLWHSPSPKHETAGQTKIMKPFQTFFQTELVLKETITILIDPSLPGQATTPKTKKKKSHESSDGVYSLC